MTTTSPWIAWPSGADPAELSARLRAAHELFVAGPGTGPGADWGADGGRDRGSWVRRVVMESWLRSRSSGVDPEHLNPPVDLAGVDLAAYRRGHALAPLMPIVRRLLVDGAGSEGLLVALADDAGRLLWVEGDHAVRRAVEEVGFVEGARWREQDAGTNAPGMALATDHEVQIFAAEHFTRAVQPWSCSAAPVHDPVTGRTLGVLDVTGRDPAASPQMAALVRATVAAMESELAVRALRAQLSDADADAQVRRRRARSSGPGGVLAVARELRAVGALAPADPVAPVDLAAPVDPASPVGPVSAVTGETARVEATGRLEVLGTSSGRLLRGDDRQVLTLRHAELLLLLGRHPGGLTGDELAALLHPGTLSGVTVRVEMSRLRRAVGDLIGGSRPYRLTDRPGDRIRTDVDDVRERLARGDVAGAVEVYRGPVLPRSEAPGVVALRDELEAELRAALARTPDVGALEAWTHGPAGADDWDAWQRLLALHPLGTPGWIRASARIDVLDRELGAPTGRLSPVGDPGRTRRPVTT
ncbi:GAF domain-containing protein [Pengzhenrongella frigida]|uniref:GAF domain-containing protein n=1 Tax=Pengzhenrongella frigida TaxID=1259133 RepID=UPI001F5D7826|nr:GAF domain-containing protein [Cellulomonas sp. HLT2-17]